MIVFVEIAGWTGAIVILVAYVLLSTRRLSGHSTTYHVMNLVGAAGIAANSGWNGAIPSAVLNVIWAGIAIYALFAHRSAPMEIP